VLFGGGILALALAIGLYVRWKRTRKEKEASDELLDNILPAEISAEIKAKGKASSRQIDDVTILFTDFKGFTAMAEKMDPQDLVEDLNTCFSEFDRIVEECGIEKIKTIGDAYMAAGGLKSNNNSAAGVIRAALKMRDFIAEGKAKKIEQGLPYFEIRLGIHTGGVVAGIVGVKKYQYDIWGDTVNTASRMESSGDVGKVNISQSTYDLVKDDPSLTFEHRGKIEAKGKGELDMFFVERV
jgi:class 3 adenylate cyclase